MVCNVSVGDFPIPSYVVNRFVPGRYLPTTRTTRTIIQHRNELDRKVSGSGCGSVGRAAASNSRGPQFKSSHWQKH